MNRIQQLHALGQSVWLDYIERSIIHSGELKALVEDGLRGVTSNPTIFQHAISKSDAYKADLTQLAKQDLDPKAIFEALEIADIQAAAGVLRPAYDASNGRDGFVSIEVAPDLAYETEQTIAEARRLHAAIDRPNLMVKVPATEAGIPAIRQLTAGGINVNITLIFGLERYAEVKDAYLTGLEERLEAGQPLERIASVASFFVSRVDSNVDERLEKLAERHPDQAQTIHGLQGKIAVANAKLAYRQFQQVFSGSRWERLAEAGAHLQRPLWASTSTKNPHYSDLLYVNNLIGPHTVNTMTPKTIEAFRDHGVVAYTIDQHVDEAEQEILQLPKLGISMREVTDELEREGVKKFSDSFDELLAAIAQRRAELVAA
ncbi:MAG: transaldolase [Caldilineaceae bacterium]|nr:transaldolase [Caldilineaceae bacterium]